MEAGPQRTRKQSAKSSADYQSQHRASVQGKNGACRFSLRSAAQLVSAPAGSDTSTGPCALRRFTVLLDNFQQTHDTFRQDRVDVTEPELSCTAPFSFDDSMHLFANSSSQPSLPAPPTSLGPESIACRWHLEISPIVILGGLSVHAPVIEDDIGHVPLPDVAAWAVSLGKTSSIGHDVMHIFTNGFFCDEFMDKHDNGALPGVHRRLS